MAQSEQYQRGMAALKAGQFARARTLFDEAEAEAGTGKATQRLLAEGLAALEEGQPEVAGPAFEQVVDQNPALAEAYQGLARLALSLGEVRAARIHATAATHLAPKDGLSWTLLGLVEEADGKEGPALRLLEKGARLGPGQFLCQFNWGRVRAASGHAAEALEPLRAAVKLSRKNPGASLCLGLALQQADQHQGAVKALVKATQLAPGRLDVWAALADLLFEQQKLAAARGALDRGLAACGDHPVLLEKAVAVAMVQADTRAALDYVRREVEVIPEHQQAWINLAGLLLLEQDLDGSERAAQEALKRDPSNWQAHFHLGNLYEAVPREAQAEAAYRQAVALAPKGEWRALTNLAALLVQLKTGDQLPEAVKLLKQAMKRAPVEELRPRYNLALAYARLGKTEDALSHARAVKKAARPGEPMAQEAAILEANLLERLD